MVHSEKLHSQIYGDMENPRVLFLHGFMGSIDDWSDIANNLSVRFSCLLIDLPGHGKSAMYDEDHFKMDFAAEAVMNILKTNDIKKCHLIGYSMGGRLGYYLLANYPDYFEKAVLESSSPGLKTLEERRQRIIQDHQLAAKIEYMDKDSFHHFLQEWYEKDFFKSIKSNSEKFDSLIDKRALNNPKQLALSLKMMGAGSQESLWDDIVKIKADVLLIAGEYDEKFININKMVCEESLNFREAVIQSAGHNAHFEQPELFIDAVNLFFR